MVKIIPEHLKERWMPAKPPIGNCSGFLMHNKRLCHCYKYERDWLENGLRTRRVFKGRCLGITYDQRPRPPQI